LIFLLEVDKSPPEITTHQRHSGCYWRKHTFHRGKALFLMLYVADVLLKIKKMPGRTTPQAINAYCESFLQLKPGLESSWFQKQPGNQLQYACELI
jgi:hypothetical protein